MGAVRGKLRVLRRYLPGIAFYVAIAAAVPGVAADEPDWRVLVANGQLIEVNKVDPTIRVEMRYATARNCVGAPIYPPDLPCLVRPEIARRLKVVQQYLRGSNCGLKVWDAYRPPEAQRAIWKRFAMRGYVADPGDGRGSLHTWGLAVDVTLVDFAGDELAMPSEFDVFTAEASGIYRGHDMRIHDNLRLLHRAMFSSGFIGLSTEWWHFAARDWQKFGRLTADPDPGNAKARPDPVRDAPGDAPHREPLPAASPR